MVTYDEVKKYAQMYNTIAYKGKYGVGIVYRAEVRDKNGAEESRLATFENVSEMITFLEKLKYAKRVVVEDSCDISAKPKFMYENQELTNNKIAQLKEKEEKEKSVYEKINGYLRNKLYNFNTIDKQINDLKNQIEQMTIYINKILEEKNSFKITNIKCIEAPLKKEEEQNENVNKDNVLREKVTLIDNLCKKYKDFTYNGYARKIIELENLKRQKSNLNNKIIYLEKIKKKNFIQRLLTSKSKIKSDLDEMKSVPFEKKCNDVENEERLFWQVVSNYKNPLERLSIIEQYESIPIENSRVDFLEEMNSCMAEKNKQFEVKRHVEDCKAYGSSIKNEKTELQQKLYEQYYNNLTHEQKEALIIYNSRLFNFISQITAIPNYEQKNGLEIWKELEENSKKNREFEILIATIYDYREFILQENLHQTPSTKKLYEILKKIIDDDVVKRLENENLNFVDKYSLENHYRVNNPEVFANGMEVIINNLLKVIKTINEIPENAITLPEDVVVYRGVRNYEGMEVQNANRGNIMSTSQHMGIAQMYITQDINSDGVIYKIKLKKGTPVLVFPEKVVRSNMFNQNIDIVIDDAQDYKSSCEIAVKMSKERELIISEESREKTYTFDKSTGTFDEQVGFPMYIGTFEERNKEKNQTLVDNDYLRG